jgi:hypothetical protein
MSIGPGPSPADYKLKEALLSASKQSEKPPYDAVKLSTLEKKTP